MIINSHVHVNTDSNYFFYSDYTMKRFISEQAMNNIDIALACINPKIGKFRCPNDCSFSCSFLNGKENKDLQNCSCSSPKRHRTTIISDNDRLKIICKTCGFELFSSSIDPLREYNISLICQTQMMRSKIKPLLYLSLCKATIQGEIDFFEKMFPNEFVGYKLHPWTDQVDVNSFKISTKLPILIHTGMRYIESAENAMIFANNHPYNSVILAHAVQLKDEILSQISRTSNVYIDCCPADFLFKHKESCLVNPDKITCPEDIYLKAMEFLPSSKILFGSDSPWGDTKKELSILDRINISEKEKNNILFRNSSKIYSLNF